MVKQYDIVRLLESTDKSITSTEDWDLISQIIKEECYISDSDKWKLLRKPSNLYQYALRNPHIRIDGYLRIFLHYYKF